MLRGNSDISKIRALELCNQKKMLLHVDSTGASVVKIRPSPCYHIGPITSSSDNGADSISSNIAPRVNKQMCTEKAVQRTMNSNFGRVFPEICSPTDTHTHTHTQTDTQTDTVEIA